MEVCFADNDIPYVYTWQNQRPNRVLQLQRLYEKIIWDKSAGEIHRYSQINHKNGFSPELLDSQRICCEQGKRERQRCAGAGIHHCVCIAFPYHRV